MSNIKVGCFILKHNQRGSFFSLIASQGAPRQICDKPFPTWWIAISRSGWKVIRAKWLRLAVIERVSQRRLSSRGEGGHLREEKKENAVSFNCAKPAWKTPAWITATVYHMGILAVRHKFRHTNRNTCALCIWIPSQGREGGFQNLFICRFPRVGLMKNSKYMDNKRVFFFVFFFTFRLIRWRYMKAVCFWHRLMPSLSAALPTSVAFD